MTDFKFFRSLDCIEVLCVCVCVCVLVCVCVCVCVGLCVCVCVCVADVYIDNYCSVTGVDCGEEAAAWLQNVLHRTGLRLVRQTEARRTKSGNNNSNITPSVSSTLQPCCCFDLLLLC